jgi:hypothetical protein
MKMKQKSEEFYVEIEDSVELRRQMLETSKELISILQQYEEIKSIDTEKIKEIEQFKSTLKEIGGDIIRLKGMMPKVKLSSLPRKETFIRELKYRAPKEEAPEPEKTEAAPEGQTEQPPVTNANKLESDLQDIEKKLQDLQE